MSPRIETYRLYENHFDKRRAVDGRKVSVANGILLKNPWRK